MNTAKQVMTELKKKGTAQNRKVYSKHGAPENMFGCSVADMKVIAKKIKGNQELALELYETGNSDAMYLAGMVADGAQMTKAQLNRWAREAPWYFVSEYAVPGVAHESKHAKDLAMKWIQAKKETVATAGWNTYSGLVATRDNEDLDLDEVEGLLDKIEEEIHEAKNRVRYTMNGFLISVGGYIKPLNKKAKAIAKKIGKVEVNMGETSCKVPSAPEYIKKMESKGSLTKKKKTIKC